MVGPISAASGQCANRLPEFNILIVNHSKSQGLPGSAGRMAEVLQGHWDSWPADHRGCCSVGLVASCDKTAMRPWDVQHTKGSQQGNSPARCTALTSDGVTLLNVGNSEAVT